MSVDAVVVPQDHICVKSQVVTSVIPHKTSKLPPCLQVEVVTPEEHMGDVIGDFNTRRGIVGEFLDKHGGLKLLKAEVPLAEMFQYVSTLRGMTKGECELWRGHWVRQVADQRLPGRNIRV